MNVHGYKMSWYQKKEDEEKKPSITLGSFTNDMVNCSIPFSNMI